jgi:DNA-binding transcriptional MerR regulator
MAKKIYYKIGEACKLLEIQPYVLRYWETEFPFLSPDKSKAGQRAYSEREFEIIGRIKVLLYEDGYTIAGAKKKIEVELKTGGSEDLGPVAAAETRPAVKKKPRSRKATPKEKVPSSTALELDSGALEKVEKLRSGVEAALGQTRTILKLLGSEAT